MGISSLALWLALQVAVLQQPELILQRDLLQGGPLSYLIKQFGFVGICFRSFSSQTALCCSDDTICFMSASLMILTAFVPLLFCEVCSHTAGGSSTIRDLRHDVQVRLRGKRVCHVQEERNKGSAVSFSRRGEIFPAVNGFHPSGASVSLIGS